VLTKTLTRHHSVSRRRTDAMPPAGQGSLPTQRIVLARDSRYPATAADDAVTEIARHWFVHDAGRPIRSCCAAQHWRRWTARAAKKIDALLLNPRLGDL